MSQVITKRFRVSRRALLKGLSLSGAQIAVGLPPLVSMFNSNGTAYAAEIPAGLAVSAARTIAWSCFRL